MCDNEREMISKITIDMECNLHCGNCNEMEEVF